MKITVKEAFEKYKEIIILYTFETTCPVCGKFYDEVDEEYSFEGDIEYFTGRWKKEYGVIDLDDDIIQLKEGSNEFAIYRSCEGQPCPKCREEE